MEGKDVVYDLSHTNFDSTLLPQMISKLQAGKPKLILTITTPVSQVAKKALANSGIPIVFSVVTDPVAAKLTPSWDKGDNGITGSSDLQDMAAVMQFAHKLVPNSKRFGMPYNPGEANDVALLEKVKQTGTTNDYQIVSVGVDNANDVQQRIASLKGKVDVLYNPTSNLLQPATPAVSAAARHECRGAHTVFEYEHPADHPTAPLGRDDVNWLKHTLWHSESNSLTYKPVNLQPLTVDSIPPKVRTF